MCDPATLAVAAASTLAKSYFDNRAAGQDAEAALASQRTFNKDVDIQRKKAQNEFDSSVQATSKPAEDVRTQEAINAREAAYQPNFDQRVLLPGQGDANSAVRMAIVNEQNQGIAENADAAKRRANLDAFGDVDLGRNIKLLQDANRISTAGNFAGGAYPVLHANMESAAHAGDSSRSTSDIIGALGTIGTIATGVDWGGFGAGDPLTKDIAGHTVGTVQIPRRTGISIPDKSVPGSSYLLK